MLKHSSGTAPLGKDPKLDTDHEKGEVQPPRKVEPEMQGESNCDRQKSKTETRGSSEQLPSHRNQLPRANSVRLSLSSPTKLKNFLTSSVHGKPLFPLNPTPSPAKSLTTTIHGHCPGRIPGVLERRSLLAQVEAPHMIRDVGNHQPDATGLHAQAQAWGAYAQLQEGC